MDFSTLSTGNPTIDRWIHVLSILVVLASALANIIPPTNVIGKALSWVALNFGRRLVSSAPPPANQAQTPPKPPAAAGFMDVRVAVALSAGIFLLACGLFRANLKADLAKCGEEAAVREAQNLFPAVIGILEGGAPDWEAQLAALEGVFVTGLPCAVQALLTNFQPPTAGQVFSDAGVAPPPGAQALLAGEPGQRPIGFRAPGAQHEQQIDALRPAAKARAQAYLDARAGGKAWGP